MRKTSSCSFCIILSSLLVLTANQVLAWNGILVGFTNNMFVMLSDEGREQVKLYGIDFPEADHPDSAKVVKAIEPFIFKDVDVTELSRDKDGSIIALVNYQGQNLNDYLVQNGYAWTDNCSRPECAQWVTMERKAKSNQVGLWSAPEQESAPEQKVLSSRRESKQFTGRTFDSFSDESKKVSKELHCNNPKITPASNHWGKLYGCIQGHAETVKWFINETPNTNRVKDVKFMWNDWYKDIGFGAAHADKNAAQKALNILIKMYAPGKSQEVENAFWGEQDKVIESDYFILKYTYDRGPAIDARMIVITEK